jgi:hypothetical protein
MSATRIEQENGTRAGRNALPLAHLGYLAATVFRNRAQEGRKGRG